LITALMYRVEGVGKEEETLHVVDMSDGRLLDVRPGKSLGEEEFGVRRGLIRKHPKTLLTTNLLPTHIYLCSKDVLGYILPPSLLLTTSKSKNKLWTTRSFKTSVMGAIARDGWTDTLLKISSGNKKDRIGVIVWEKEDGFVGRCNRVRSYGEVCRSALSHNFAHLGNSNGMKYPPSQVSPDCRVMGDLVLGEKSSLKKTSIGNEVAIGRYCKLVGCVLMDGVVVGDNVKLENCILCPGAKINNGVNLNECEVGTGFEVAEGVTAKDDQFAL